MDLDSASKSIKEFDIKKHCHVNTNEDGDRFVGIKADSDNAMVYFPIGYELPKTDAEIRTDIKHLIQVLSEFTTKDDRLLAINKKDLYFILTTLIQISLDRFFQQFQMMDK